MITLLGLGLAVKGQTCQQSLEEAQIAYFNGRFQSCIVLLNDCVNQLSNKEDRVLALEIMAKSQLMLGQENEAEGSMYQILKVNPFYTPRKDLSVSLEALYERFRLRRQWQAGISMGYLAAHYEVLKTWSFSGLVVDPARYDARPSLQFEIWSTYDLYRGLQIEAGFGFQTLNFYRQELQQNYLLQSSLESYQMLSPRLGLQYEYGFKNWSFFANSGASLAYLQNSIADIAIEPQAGEIPAAFGGYPARVENFDLNFQRKDWLMSGYLGGGVRYGIGNHRFEFSYRLHQTWQNMVDADARYTNAQLVNDLAYVPDDFIISYGSWQIGYLYTFLKPEKK